MSTLTTLVSGLRRFAVARRPDSVHTAGLGPQYVPRVGTDVQSVDEVSAAVERFGDRYTRRLFTEQEIASCTGSPGAVVESLAARFAAKEAVFKVLRVGASTGPQLREVEVVRSSSGACTLRLHGAAARLAEQRGLDNWDLSMSHTRSIATATAVALAAVDHDPSGKASEEEEQR